GLVPVCRVRAPRRSPHRRRCRLHPRIGPDGHARVDRSRGDREDRRRQV
ncbi:MAG: Putative transposase, partial [uncultured Nocardioides sp.]